MLVEGDAAALERALRREIELWEAYKNRDIATLERLIDPLALDVGPWGIASRERVLEIVASYSIAAYRLDALKVLAASEVEIVTYVAQVDATYAGTPIVWDRTWSSSTWFGGDTSAWRLIHRHEAPISE